MTIKQLIGGKIGMETKENTVLQYKNLFQQCLDLSEKYKLPCKKIKSNMAEADKFKVTTPIIGGFSTGKSSMINAVLEDDVLPFEITPETAIPTEVYYGNNRVLLCYDKLVKQISIDEYKNMELDADVIRLVKLEYENNFLRQIPDVKIVDMPGFDSGIELHNRAIDNYIPYSLAYIITFSAEEPVIKESISNFLKELKLHGMPIYVVITKCDKVSDTELRRCIEFMEENIPKLLGIESVTIVCEKAKRNRDVTEVKNILLEIQKKSQDIFKRKFSIELKEAVLLIEKYVINRIKGMEFTDSELEDKQKKLKKNISEITEKIQREKISFQSQTNKCVTSIKTKINSDLAAASSLLENMIYNGHDITDKINMIVRNSVIWSIKSEFEPRLQRYLKNVVELIHVDLIADTEVNLNNMQVAVDKMMKEVVVKTLPAIIAVIGTVLTGPILGIIAAVLSAFVEGFFKSKREKEKRELISQKVRSEVIPQITEEAAKNVEIEITSYVEQINEEIYRKVQEQKNVMEKSLEDIKAQKQQEAIYQKKEIDDLNRDLEKVRGILSGI